MPPVADIPVHAKVKADSSFRYGCNNKPRPVAGEMIEGSMWYGGQQWPFANSTTCRHDNTRNDPGCKGCAWIAK